MGIDALLQVASTLVDRDRQQDEQRQDQQHQHAGAAWLSQPRTMWQVLLPVLLAPAFRCVALC